MIKSSQLETILSYNVFTYQYISIWKLFVIIVPNTVSLLFQITITLKLLQYQATNLIFSFDFYF